MPDPGYPVYATGTRFAGGEEPVPLPIEAGFVPEIREPDRRGPPRQGSSG